MLTNIRRPLPIRGLFLTIALGAGTDAVAHEPEPSRYSYYEHVLPIIQEHCADCHQPGGIAPMSLLDYQESISWAKAMKLKVLEGTMPPWLPREGVGAFEGARSLSAEEIDMLVEWATGGTPEGEADSATGFSNSVEDGWNLGDPDLVLAPEEEVVVGADEAEKTVCVVLPTGLEEGRWVSAFELKPGASSMVHDVVIRLGDTCSLTLRPVASWLPGDEAFHTPDGTAERLPAGARLALEIHYQKTWNDDGKVLRDRSKLGLRFVREGEENLQAVRALLLDDEHHRLAEGSLLLAFFPAPASQNLPVRVTAHRPDGQTQVLFQIDRYDASWRTKYKLQQPISMPPGTVLESASPAIWIDYIPTNERTN